MREELKVREEIIAGR